MLDESILLGDEKFEENMKCVVAPFLEEYEKSGFLKSYDGTKIHFYTYEQKESLGHVVICHGFCEYAQKFEEMIYYLVKSGYSVYVPDHRGHGYSDRKVTNDEMVHVDSYEEYVDDLHEFVTKMVPANNRYIIAHSMGGAIAIRYLEKYPEDFEKAVLSSPMCGMKTGKHSNNFALLWASLKCRLGAKNSFANGQHGFGEPTFDTCSCLDRPRYMYQYNKRVANTNYRTYGGSFGWVKASIKATKKLMNKKNINKITTPILIFQAGLDHLVKTKTQEEFLNRCKMATMISVKDAKHEIFNCHLNHRKLFYKETLSFLEQ